MNIQLPLSHLPLAPLTKQKMLVGVNEQDHFQGDFSVLCFVDTAVIYTMFTHRTNVEKNIPAAQFVSLIFCTNKFQFTAFLLCRVGTLQADL